MKSNVEIGAEIYDKFHDSAIVTKKMAFQWLEVAKDKAGKEIEYGFYRQETLRKITAPEKSK